MTKAQVKCRQHTADRGEEPCRQGVNHSENILPKGLAGSEIPYRGSLTAEQFLFREMRIVSRLYVQGKPLEDIVRLVRQDNLFQYPTEREISRLTRACHKRLLALGNENLAGELANAPAEIAKQINLYSMMCYNRLVRDFMISLVGEKFRSQDFSFSRKDMNVFFLALQQQRDDVSAWSEKTIAKLKQVLVKSLVETEMLDDAKAARLNPVFLCEELERGIRENNDLEALPAFNCFR
jgi:hypothetical protein